MSDRRTRKRLATRQSISDTATRLFMEHGFDQVTVDQIASAADVGRMTVFNHFPRKEDMFFDREDDLGDVVSRTLHDRPGGTGPIEALRLLAHRLVEQRHPLVPLFCETRRFVATALASEALKARARQLCGEFTRTLSAMLAISVARPTDDPDAHLVSALLVATCSVAFAEAHDAVVRHGDTAAAAQIFLDLIDRGTRAVTAAVRGTPYAEGRA